MVWKCRKCSRAIEPDDLIISISCGTPSKFEQCEITWHVGCAPMIVRQHMPPAKGGITLLEQRPE